MKEVGIPKRIMLTLVILNKAFGMGRKLAITLGEDESGKRGYTLCFYQILDNGDKKTYPLAFIPEDEDVFKEWKPVRTWFQEGIHETDEMDALVMSMEEYPQIDDDEGETGFGA